MAKKTKKEKILAEYHRKLASLEPQKYSLKTPKTFTPSAVPSDRTDYSYVLTDLKRIAILTALAICAQVVLWYYVGRR